MTLVPFGTGKFQCISFASLGSQRSVSKRLAGVDDGTLEFTFGTGDQAAALLPLLRSELGSVESSAQSGPASNELTAEPPALTR